MHGRLHQDPRHALSLHPALPAVIFLFLICNLSFAVARPGAIQTRDGKRHEGELSFTNGAVQVSNAVEIISIARADITRLSFDPEQIAPASPANGEGMGLLGYYFGNTNVHGPVQVRLDPMIDFDWGTGEAVAGVGKDYFAVIWMGQLEAPATGEFTFSLIADDNARLQLGPELVMESLKREQHGEVTGTLALEKGQRYPLTLLYQDNIGAAKIRLSWSGPELPKTIIPADRLYPASFVVEHTASMESRRGLLATTYKTNDFSGPTSTRVASSVDASITGPTRWSGQVRADDSELFTFYVVTDGPVRLRIGGKTIIDQWTQHGLAELKGTIALTGGELGNLQLETLPGDGSGTRRLLWSSASQTKSVISQSHLTPFQHALEPTGPDQPLPAGVLLRNGSFIAGRIESMQDDRFLCTGLLDGKKIPAHEVARIVYQPVPRAFSARVPPGRSGVLLANGDFIEGEFTGMNGARVTISSVLFGLRSYDTSRQALAVILRATENSGAPCEIQLRDQSIIYVTDIALEGGNIVLKDKLLAGLSLPESQIQGFRLR